MSWWISEVLSTNRDMTERLCKCECDDTSVFPDAVQYKEDTTTVDYTIVRGSYLYCLSNSKTYRLNTSNQWVEQKDSTLDIDADNIIYDNTSSGMTATNVQDAIDELHTTDETQDLALFELYGEYANQQLEINYAINTGAKNALKVESSTQTINGVTFTVNDDQTITVNGTASATATYMITPNAQAILIPDGNYVLSGCPSGGGTTTFDLRWYLYSSGKSAYDNGSGASVEKNGNTTSSNVAIVIRSGVTANNLVFKPMLRRAEITDSTFQPYAQTNPELSKSLSMLNDFIFGFGTALSSGDNLNSLTYAVRAYASTGTIAAAIINTPWTASGFTIWTIPFVAANNFIQILIPNTSGGKWYKRRYTSSAWGSWIEYDGTEVTQNLQSISPSLNTLNLGNDELNLRSEELDTNFDLMNSLEDEGVDLDV